MLADSRRLERRLAISFRAELHRQGRKPDEPAASQRRQRGREQAAARDKMRVHREFVGAADPSVGNICFFTAPQNLVERELVEALL